MSNTVQAVIGATLSPSFTSAFGKASGTAATFGKTVAGLGKNTKSLADLETAYNKASAAMATARTRLEEINRRIASGEEQTDQLVNAWVKAETAFERAQTRLGKASAQLYVAEGRTDRLGDAMASTAVKADKAAASSAKAATANQRIGDTAAKAAAQQKRLNDQLEANRAKQRLNETVRADKRGQMLDAAAGGLLVGTPIVMAAKFETAMLGVAKQVAGARDESGQLTEVYHGMSKQIQQLGREIPIATNELADMVAAGARMGVAKDELVGFTRTAAMMADAFELPAGELADDMGKIAGLYKIPIKSIGQLADAVNYLDDNAISKGGDIVNFLSRVGGSAAVVKITAKDTAALGSTLLTLGERAEVAGTAANALFVKLAAAEQGNAGFQTALSSIGLTAKEVQMGMQSDATRTILRVMDAVNRMPKEARTGVLVDLAGVEHVDTFAKLAANTAEYRKQLGMANSEQAKGSMQREFAARLQTTNAQMQIMRNRVSELAVNLGSALLPAINNIFGAVAPVIAVMADFAREHPHVTTAIFGTVAALAALKLAMVAGGYANALFRGEWLKMGEALLKGKGKVLQLAAGYTTLNAAMAASPVVTNSGKIASSSLRIAGSLGLIQGGITKLGITAVGFMVSNPLGWLLGAVALLAFGIYKYWKPISAFIGGFFDGITQACRPALDALKPFEPVFRAIGEAMKGFLGQADASQETLQGFAKWGRMFGWVIGNTVMKPLQQVASVIKFIGEGIRSLGRMMGFNMLSNDSMEILKNPAKMKAALASVGMTDVSALMGADATKKDIWGRYTDVSPAVTSAKTTDYVTKKNAVNAGVERMDINLYGVADPKGTVDELEKRYEQKRLLMMREAVAF